MLELEKIKLEKPKKLDMFKKAINDADEKNRALQTLDFFKTSKKKTNIFHKIHHLLLLAFALNIGVGLIEDHSQSKIINTEINNSYKLFNQISNEIQEKNTVNISLYRLLKSSPLFYSDILSSVVA